MGHREPLQKSHRCHGRSRSHRPVCIPERFARSHRSHRHRQRHLRAPRPRRVPLRLHHQTARMGTGTFPGQAHRGGIPSRPHLREAQPAWRRHHFCHRTAGVVTGCQTRGQKGNRVKESKGQKSQWGKRVKEKGKNYLPLKISSSFASNSCSRSPVAIIFPSGSISTISGMAFTPYISDAMDSHPFTSDR